MFAAYFAVYPSPLCPYVDSNIAQQRLERSRHAGRLVMAFDLCLKAPPAQYNYIRHERARLDRLYEVPWLRPREVTSYNHIILQRPVSVALPANTQHVPAIRSVPALHSQELPIQARLIVAGDDLYSIDLMDPVPDLKESLEATLEHLLPETHIYHTDLPMEGDSRTQDNALWYANSMAPCFTLHDPLPSYYPHPTLAMLDMAHQPLQDRYLVSWLLVRPTNSAYAAESVGGTLCAIERVAVLPAEPIWKRLLRIKRGELLPPFLFVHDVPPVRTIFDSSQPLMLAAPMCSDVPHYLKAYTMHILARWLLRLLPASEVNLHEPFLAPLEVLYRKAGGRR